MNESGLRGSAQRVQDALDALGLKCEVVELPGSTRTAVEAAEAVGCKVDQIAKSLVFKGKRTDKPILVVASGSNRVDEKKLKEVCEYVNADKFIRRFKDGCFAKITERGGNLSTGQRQLLAFARALYHEPRILLLDEATSAVDTETEELIQEALGKLTREMTSIVVAHRLSTVKSADRILVMHKGELHEEGAYGEDLWNVFLK